MAKSREQMIQEQLGAMAFQIAVLAADLEATREENEALKAKGEEAKQAPARISTHAVEATLKAV